MSEPKQYILDSSFMVALIDAADVHHKKAARLWHQIQTSQAEAYLSDVLINEVLSVFAKRCEAKKKESYFTALVQKFQQALAGVPVLCLYELIAGYYQRILSLMIQHQGRLNFHDALIALFLQQITNAYLVSFDSDFKEIPWIKLMS